MKKKYIIGIIILVVIASIIYLVNKDIHISKKVSLKRPHFSILTKKKSNSVTLISLRKSHALEKEYHLYFDDLKSCYDDGYFYDQKRNITITDYKVTKGKFYQTIEIKYIKNDYCKREYILDKKYLEKLVSADYKNIIVNKYTIKKGVLKTSNIPLDKKYFLSLIKEIIKEPNINDNNNYGYDMDDNNYVIEAFYYLDKDYYSLHIFNEDGLTIVRVVGMDDHPSSYVINKKVDIEAYYTKGNKK